MIILGRNCKILLFFVRKKTRAMHVDDHCLNFGGSLHGRVRLFIFSCTTKCKKKKGRCGRRWFLVPDSERVIKSEFRKIFDDDFTERGTAETAWTGRQFCVGYICCESKIESLVFAQNNI